MNHLLHFAEQNLQLRVKEMNFILNNFKQYIYKSVTTAYIGCDCCSNEFFMPESTRLWLFCQIMTGWEDTHFLNPYVKRQNLGGKDILQLTCEYMK